MQYYHYVGATMYAINIALNGQRSAWLTAHVNTFILNHDTHSIGEINGFLKRSGSFEHFAIRGKVFRRIGILR